MTRCAPAVVLVLALMFATPTAACPSLPDDAGTGYVGNNTALALCLQRQLALEAELAAQRARIEADLNRLQMDLQRQQLSAQPLWRPPAANAWLQQ